MGQGMDGIKGQDQGLMLIISIDFWLHSTLCSRIM